MENKSQPTISMMSQNDQLRLCKCELDKAIFYCLKGCDSEIATHQPIYYCYERNNCTCTLIKKLDIFCCISDVEYQREYCVLCGSKTHFDHGSVLILMVVDELDKHHWSLLFEKIQHLQEVTSQKYEPYQDITKLLEDMFKQKVVSDPQSSPLFSDMHQMLKSLYEETIMKYKEKVEELINQKKVTELFKLKDAFLSFNLTYEKVKPLEHFDPKLLYERYIQIFQYPFNKEYLNNLSYSNFLLMKEYKKKFVDSLLSTSNTTSLNQNKQDVINTLFMEYFMIEELHNIKANDHIRKQLIDDFNNKLMEVNGVIEETKEEAKSFMENNQKEFKDTRTELKITIDDVKKGINDNEEEAHKKIYDDISVFKNQITQEINQMNNSNNQKHEMFNNEIILFRQLLQKKVEEFCDSKDTIEFEGKIWKILFGVNSTDIYDYKSDFWTKKQELNPQPEKRVINFNNSFKLKAFWEYKFEQLLIISQSGLHTILGMPTNNKSLMDYFNDEEIVTNLTYVSGAKDPVELINKKQGINFYEQVWRINSKRTDGRKFMTRLGGYYYNGFSKDERYKDNKQQVIDAEMAGFGILDEWSTNRVYGNKSFGIRTWNDSTGGQGQVQIGGIVCAL